jgi:hypothetical protein
MDSYFSGAGGAANRKFAPRETKVARFSPSYGVRKGFIKDPNWPPAEFPEEGNATQRRFRRMPASFAVTFEGGAPITVVGNLSSGGAMFSLPTLLSSDRVTVHFGGKAAAAQVIASETKASSSIAPTSPTSTRPARSGSR